MKIIVDTLGGDFSPAAHVEGAVLAASEEKDIQIILVGYKEKIKEELDKYVFDKNRITIVPCETEILNSETPTLAVKKVDSSMMTAIKILKEDDDAKCLISSGNTGALLTAGILKIGRQKGVVRPALVSFLPQFSGSHFALIDSGANVDCKVNFLLQFAVFGCAYVKNFFNIKSPKVGLLSIGSEDTKGNELVKNANELFKKLPFDFIGNIEARDVYFKDVDVVVSDGFDGNILLKTTEGTGLIISKVLKEKIFIGAKGKLSGLLIKNKLRILKNLFDYTNIGGAPFLGLQKLIIKSHGSANSKTIKAAILQAKKSSSDNMQNDIIENIALINNFFDSFNKEKGIKNE